jgi:hypothetical protein
MDLETKYYQSRAQQRPYRFDPWMAEIDAMNHTAANMATVFDGLGSLILRAFRAIGNAVQAVRPATPLVEVESVKIVRPAQMVETLSANDRAAA